jgi:parallel beta-helix repeat protein
MRPTIFLVLILLWLPLMSQGAERYASPSGSGTACSLSAPCALRTGIDQTYPGDILYLRGGIYNQQIDSNTQVLHSGSSWSDAPQFKAYPGETPVIRPTGISGTGDAAIALISCQNANPGLVQYLIFDGLSIDGSQTGFSGPWNAGPQAFDINGAQHIRLIHIDAYQFPGVGIHFSSSNGCHALPSDHEILFSKFHHMGRGNTGTTSGQVSHGIYGSSVNTLYDGIECYHNGDLGMQLFSESGGINNNVVRNSKFYENGQILSGGGGLYLGSGDSNVAYNNLAWGNGVGFTIGSGSTNAKLFNNTSFNNRDGGIVLTSQRGSQVRNNIMYLNGSAYGDYQDLSASATTSNNLCTSAGSGCAGVK